MKISKEKLKNSKNGITLVALIITVILLLILAGVTITLFIGNDNLLNQISNAKKEHEKATLQEMAELYIQNLNLELAFNSNLLDNGAIDIKDVPITFNGKAPNIGWIYLENNFVTKYEFYYDDFYMLSVNGNLIVEDFNFTELINVKDYGAVGDGITDDTVAIQKAIDYLNDNGGTLYFPIGTYCVSVLQNGESIIKLQSDKDINIDFFGSTIALQPNQYKAYNIININECKSAKVQNGFLVGDRKEHDYTTVNSTHEWGVGIRINQSSSATVFNMEVSEMTGDAIYTVNDKVGETIINYCNLHHSRRQGITILQSDVVSINNTNIYNIGDFDNIVGASPKSGIDIEPEGGTMRVNNIYINNVNISNISGLGIVMGSECVDNLVISNSDICASAIRKASILNSILRNDISALSALNLINVDIINSHLVVVPRSLLYFR